jgi:hypothetical protein
MRLQIYLLEADLEQAKKITDLATANEIQVEAVSGPDELKNYVNRKMPDAVLAGYQWIQPQISGLTFLKDLFTIVYGSQITVKDKIQIYDAGISRVEDWESGGAELLINLLKIHLSAEKEIPDHPETDVTFGSLNDFQLKDIVLNSMFESTNLAFKIDDGSWAAKLRTYQGEIVEASCPEDSGQPAAINILMRNNGSYRMRSYSKPKEISSDSASTFSLLLETDFRRKYLSRFIEQVGTNNPVFKKISGADKINLNSRENELFQKIAVGADLNTLLWQEPSRFLENLRLVEKLIQKGVIAPDLTSAETEKLKPEDIDYIRNKLLKAHKSEGRIAVLGYPENGKFQFIHTLAETFSSPVKSAQGLEFTRIQLTENLRLNFFGMGIDSYFQPVLQKLSSNLVAGIFLLNYEQQQNIDYSKYLIQQFMSSYQVPLVFGLTNVPDHPEKKISEMRDKLDIPQEYDMVPMNTGDFSQIKKIFYHLK